MGASEINLLLLMGYAAIVLGFYYSCKIRKLDAVQKQNLPYSSGIMFLLLGTLGSILSPEMVGYQVPAFIWIGLIAFAMLWTLGIYRDAKVIE